MRSVCFDRGKQKTAKYDLGFELSSWLSLKDVNMLTSLLSAMIHKAKQTSSLLPSVSPVIAGLAWASAAVIPRSAGSANSACHKSGSHDPQKCLCTYIPSYPASSRVHGVQESGYGTSESTKSFECQRKRKHSIITSVCYSYSAKFSSSRELTSPA